MIVSWTSVKEVISRIVRNTGGNFDPSMKSDFKEWIAEAIMGMETHYQLELRSVDIDIKFHKAVIPCDARWLAAVIYKNHRVMLGSGMSFDELKCCSDKDIYYYTRITLPSGEEVCASETDTNSNNYLLYNQVETIKALPYCNHWYFPNYNKIDTDIEKGQFKIYYWGVPEADGFPVIPDNELYKRAIYWYVLMMMIGAGYQHPVISFEKAEFNYYQNQQWAINDITYPTVDQVEKSILMNTGFGVDYNYGYWDNLA